VQSRPTAIGAATISGGAMTLPMVGGTVNVPTMRGTMDATGGLEISAAWAKLIDHLVGLHVVHAGETIGQLSMTIKMG
jgi:hypothetical protein